MTGSATGQPVKWVRQQGGVMAERMPALFIGHGNPMNALEDNEYTKAWARLGRTLPRPRAVLAISAHWYIGDTAVTVSERPETVHDFGGFPRELYQVQYPAPGDPALAARVQELLRPLAVRSDAEWGLDHGTWTVLGKMYPQADVPVVQLSMSERQQPQQHYEIGQRLAALREQGVLIFASGNLVHNLHTYAWRRKKVETYEWAAAFEQRVREHLLTGDDAPLVEYETRLGREALLAAPTPEHYLPLLYLLGARQPGEPVTFPVEGVDGGSISMLAVQAG
jgi:4,5-DOPA dioxygenase extradiol